PPPGGGPPGPRPRHPPPPRARGAVPVPPRGPAPAPASRVLQLTCSPVHNSIPRSIRTGFRFGWSRAGRWIGRALTRHGRTGAPPVTWGRAGGPWFGNQLMTLTLLGRKSALTLVQATAGREGAQLETVLERSLTPEGEAVSSHSTEC
ncbi:hypothetical protein ACFVFD_35930, partial [Streptomyces fimicarius]